MENGCVVHLCACSESAEFSGVLRVGEIPLDMGEDACGELHRREGGNNGKQKPFQKTGENKRGRTSVATLFWVDYSVTVHTGIQERGDEDCNKRGI